MNSGKPLTQIKTYAAFFCLLAILLFFQQPAHAAPPLAVYDCAAQTSIPQSECEALLAIYYSTGGDSWVYNNWLVGDVCGWFDLACSGGHIFYLRLTSGFNPVGTIPPEIGDLPYLDYLELSGSGLSGALPNELGNLTNLRDLRITNTSITGGIPASLGNLASLEYLRLHDNQFSGTIPTQLGNLNNLSYLILRNNNLSGNIPTELGNMGNLWYLDLSSNNLAGPVPSEIGNLNNLNQFYISDNPALSGHLPANLTNLTSLTIFDFSNTNLCEPQDSAFQTWLSGVFSVIDSEVLCEIDCTAQTSVPQTECEALVTLYYDSNGGTWGDSTNWLSSDDVCIWNGVICSGGVVTDLNLNGNNLDGSIPTSIDNLANLNVLDLSGNLLSGALPGEIGNIAPLITLNISGNAGLTGSLPSNLTNLAALTTLNFSSTDLCEPQESAFQTWLAGITTTSSGIPCEIDCALQASVSQVECEALFSVYNSTNGDSWTDKTNWLYDYDVCTWNGVICSGGSVSELNLPANNLVGSIPATIDDLSNLTILNLSSNQLTGLLPSEIGNIVPLDTLDVSNNIDLTGSLPSNLTNLAALTTLNFSSTKLCEPQDAAFQTWLSALTVTGSGILCPVDCAVQTSVPQTECEALVTFYNRTNGDSWTNKANWLENYDVCSWFGITCFGGNVVQIVFPYNNLTGSIPPEIGNFPNMAYLVIGGSSITGQIPVEIGNLNNLLELWIFETDISGSLPATIGNLTNLNEIWIYANQISGNIPTSLGKLSNTTILILAENQFSGGLPPELANMVNLRVLAVDFNNLGGTLPSTLGNLTFLQFLSINDNNFSGEIPGSFVNLINLQEFYNQNNNLCIPNSNTALINWYQNLPVASPIYTCNPVVNTDTPTPTGSGSGGSTAPTSTSLPTNTPTITFTPTITYTPTLVFPFQTLTQMAWEDTQMATSSFGIRTATTQPTATLYYNQEQASQTPPAGEQTTNGGSEVGSQANSGSQQLNGGNTKTSNFTKILIPGLIIAALGSIGLLFFLKNRKREDPNSQY